MNKFEALEKTMCRELETLEQKVSGGNEMSVQELDKIDKLVHAMKSLATYNAMKDAEEYSDNMSGRRARGMDGRFISRGMDEDKGFSEGYSRGFEEGQRQIGRLMPPYERYRY